MTQSVSQRSFAGGELAPTIAARVDLPRFATSLRNCRNFIVQRHGGAANRPGTRFVAATKTVTGACQLLRYVSEIDGESVLIECGDGYFRFYVAGAPVRVAGVAVWSASQAYVVGDLVTLGGAFYYATANSTNVSPPSQAAWYLLPGDLYEIPHPFPAPALCRAEQSGAVITLTDHDVVPHDLTFDGLTSWTVVPIVTKPGILPPTNMRGTTSGGTDGKRWQYVVTAADKNTYEESEPSAPHAVFRAVGPSANEPFTTIFDPVGAFPNSQAAEYYIYLDKYKNGIYGYIGTLVWNGDQGPPAPLENEFHDIGFPPDFSQSPPVPVRLFNAPGGYPAMAAYYQQRRFFANSRLEPETIWGSRYAFPSNFGLSSPLQDDDALTFRVAGNQRHPVLHLIGLGPILLLTGRGAWLVQGSGDGPLIPTSVQANQFGYFGASPVPPVVVGKTVIYVQARGRIVRDLTLEANTGILSRDLTLYAGHLFRGQTIRKLEFAETPHSVIWAVRSDGILLGCTYVPDDDVWGWHRHDTGAAGKFRDVCVVPELDEDVLYAIVERTINGEPKRYIERFAKRDLADLTEAFFVDAGLSYSGAPVSIIGGLEHLEGEILAVVGDGTVVFNGDPTAAVAETFRVVGGQITLPNAYSVIHAGLPIRWAELETLDLDAPGVQVRDKRKRVQGVTILVDQSARGYQAGPDRAHLTPYRPEQWESASGLIDDALQMLLTASWEDGGRVVIRQPDPLPLTVLGLIPNLDLGG